MIEKPVPFSGWVKDAMICVDLNVVQGVIKSVRMSEKFAYRVEVVDGRIKIKVV
jgi:hypothetical protein